MKPPKKKNDSNRLVGVWTQLVGFFLTWGFSNLPDHAYPDDIKDPIEEDYWVTGGRLSESEESSLKRLKCKADRKRRYYPDETPDMMTPRELKKKK